MYSSEHVEAALKETLAKVRADIVQSWASEPDPRKREELWAEHNATERIEERIRNDFTQYLRRASGGE